MVFGIGLNGLDGLGLMWFGIGLNGLNGLVLVVLSALAVNAVNLFTTIYIGNE